MSTNGATTSPASGSPSRSTPSVTFGELLGAAGPRIRWGHVVAWLAALVAGEAVEVLVGRLLSDWQFHPLLLAHSLAGDLVLTVVLLASYRWIRHELLVAPAAALAFAIGMAFAEIGLDAALGTGSTSPFSVEGLMTALHRFSSWLLVVLALVLLVPRLQPGWWGVAVGLFTGALASRLLAVPLRLIGGGRFHVDPWRELLTTVESVLAISVLAGVFWIGLRLAGYHPASPGGVPFQRAYLVWSLVGLSLTAALALLHVHSDGFLGGVDIRRLGIVAALALFSLTGLAASLRIEKRGFASIGWVGMAASAAGVILAVVVGVVRRPDPVLGNLLASATILALAAALASLTLLADHRGGVVRILCRVTVALLSIDGVLATVHVFSHDLLGRDQVKTVETVTLLGLLGVGVTALLARLGRLGGSGLIAADGQGLHGNSSRQGSRSSTQ